MRWSAVCFFPSKVVYSKTMPMPSSRDRMTIQVTPLSSPEAGDPRMGGTVEERVAAVAELTLHAWRLAGRALPRYTRATMPVCRATLADHPGSV